MQTAIPHGHRTARERGSILMTALVLAVMLAMLTLLLVSTSTDVIARVGRRAEDVRLEAVGEAAVDLSVANLWGTYQHEVGEGGSSLRSFRTFLDAAAIPGRAVEPGASGDFHIFERDMTGDPAWKDVLETSALPRDTGGRRTLDGAEVRALEVMREDATQATALRVRATVSFGLDPKRRAVREIERAYFVGGEKFRGFEFALLANNVNCIMCHAYVDSSERYYNRDPGLYGTFQRVRVGTLETLKIRSSSAGSTVAGAIYTRGPLMDKGGTILTDLTRSSLVSTVFDADLNLTQGGTGGLTETSFVNAVGDPLPEGRNLYLNYPRAEDKQTDGPLPEEFPPVIPDENGNRLVDDFEFDDVAAKAAGTITGGYKVIVPKGGRYLGSTLPAFDATGPLTGSVSGNLVLVGTPTNPLLVDGRLAVDGDVVMAGVVKGQGEILARANFYVVGSVRYADGIDGMGYRTFGVAQDGTVNRLTVASGGSVMLGDFLTSKGADDPVTGEPTGDFNFTLAEVTLFNQMEWTHTQEQLPDSGGVLRDNPLYEPGETPRYYAMYPTNPVVIFNKRDTYFDAATRTWLGKEHPGNWDTRSMTFLPPGSPELSGAVVQTFAPQDGWLDGEQLVGLWGQCEGAHPGGPLTLDAFVYTNNAIVLVTHKSSVYGGSALVNGGLVGSDLAILVPGTSGVGLQLNFDSRHENVITLREIKKGELELTRGPRLR